jgi:hypothetical protein
MSNQDKKVVKNPEELRKVIFEHFEPIFKKVDQKSHDIVDEPELKLLIAESLLKNVDDLSIDEFNKYKILIDKNNTGKITYEDYVNIQLFSSNTSLVKELMGLQLLTSKSLTKIMINS